MTNQKKYDYLVVGAGPFGAIFAHEVARLGKRILVIEKRPFIGGNLHTHEQYGIHIHDFGAHIFHTDNKEVWQYINQFAEFNSYTNQVIANYKGELYNLPFNMNTFYQMWGVKTPLEAQQKIEQQKQASGITGTPKNLQEQAISLIGTDIYEKLIKGYTEKQWGRLATELPAFIIKRLPVRFTFDNNYFNHRYQGVPIGGYTQIFDKLLANELIDVQLNTDFLANKAKYLAEFPKIIYTGMIDQFYDYSYGELEYRSLKFETEVLNMDNYQGNAVINYTERKVPYTRVMEWKHFEFGKGQQDKTIITREFPQNWDRTKEAYYPINDQKNTELYKKYRQQAQTDQQILFGGRLGKYRYYDMDQVIHDVLLTIKKEFSLPDNYQFVR
ncbi:UDP-galactopyranose mutase [Periweissella beninensis]|uniref:UDP-galactopyranose mutase n=1 Tax=Periweissella beninensis TaxID=504936 RepID=UPI0021A65A2C|nr:UDP-galactopyranose mutase [Periweissella beninensis]MCT4396509.1 UDP-galactopyranose mutase [Periweissella beninensis]